MKVTDFYKDGQRIVEILEMDKKRYSEYAADCRHAEASRETNKAIREYIDWVLKWITEREEGEKAWKRGI